MRSIKKITSTMIAAGVVCLAAYPALATQTRTIGHTTFMMGEEQYEYMDWVYFGGCEDDDDQFSTLDCYGRLSKNYNDRYNHGFKMGSLGVKQGMYQLNADTYDNFSGKFVLQYNYRLRTTEDVSSQADVAYIKVKDVDTNEVYYLNTLYPGDATAGEWIKVRQVLPTELASHQLQLVFEVLNDDVNITRLAIDDVMFDLVPNPELVGYVKETVDGELAPVAGATVQLQTLDGEIVAETVTASDGQYSLTGLPAQKAYKIVASPGNKSGEKITTTLRSNLRYKYSVQIE